MFLRARAKRSLLKILVFVLLTSTGFYTAFRVGDTSVSAEGTVTNLTTGTAASGLSWYAITSSSDGTKLAAAETGSGDIWTSTDSGSTWTNQTTGTGASGHVWYSIAGSSDGTKLAALEPSGDIWTSTDSGETWTNQTTGTGASARGWVSLTSSADGAKLAALDLSTGDIWTSADSGETWTNQTTGTAASVQYWQSVASSADGTKLVAVTAFGDGSTGDIWTSTDSGETWTNQTTGTAATNQSWLSVSSSVDGTKLAAIVANGDIWTSTDSGATWTNQTKNTTYSGQNWQKIISSADGTRLAASVGGGDVFISNDSGVTWVDRTIDTVAAGIGATIAMSEDGLSIVAAAFDGDIFSLAAVPGAGPITATGAAAGIIFLLYGLTQIPLSVTNGRRVVVEASRWLLYLVAPLRKRTFPWGTVYDAATKEPIDPAQVHLLDMTGTEVAVAITDMDGRFGFIVAPGTYRLQVDKTNYTFPSKRLAGKRSDIVYDDLYFGDTITIDEAGSIRCNVPMDPVEEDWNQLSKRRARLTNFVRFTDRYVVFFGVAAFVVGFGVSVWQWILEPTLPALTVVGCYGAIAMLYVLRARTRLYGRVLYPDKTPLSFGVMSFTTVQGIELSKRVLDAYGRYVALFPAAKISQYHMTIAAREADETYVPKIEKEVVVHDGLLNDDFVVQ